MTRLLSIDTSGPILGIALLHNGEVCHASDDAGPLRHVEQVVPRLDSALARAAWLPQDLTAVAISAGPGSFTGLRVGMAAAKAIALAGGIPVVSVDTLLALAATERYRRGAAGGSAGEEPSPSIVVPVLDARKNRYYAAAFRNDPELTRLTEDGDLTLEELAQMIRLARPDGTDLWCAPGPIAEILRDEPGYVAAATRHESAATGVALIGYRRLQQRDAAVDTDYQGPFYLRTGDIGKRSSIPRFSPTTQESESD